MHATSRYTPAMFDLVFFVAAIYLIWQFLKPKRPKPYVPLNRPPMPVPPVVEYTCDICGFKMSVVYTGAERLPCPNCGPLIQDVEQALRG